MKKALRGDPILNKIVLACLSEGEEMQSWKTDADIYGPAQNHFGIHNDSFPHRNVYFAIDRQCNVSASRMVPFRQWWGHGSLRPFLNLSDPSSLEKMKSYIKKTWRMKKPKALEAKANV